MVQVSLTIKGQPASKSNRRKIIINRKTKRPQVIKSAEARAYSDYVRAQVAVRTPLLTGPLSFTATIYYASRRPDLDAAVLLDALQGRLYENDRQIFELHLIKALDRQNPRTELVLEQIEDEQGTFVATEGSRRA